MRETISNCYIDIVTIRKQPGRLVAQVRMTRATLLRSRMNGNVHVRFCSRVGMATSRLRPRTWRNVLHGCQSISIPDRTLSREESRRAE